MTDATQSRLPGFHKGNLEQRRAKIAQRRNLSVAAQSALGMKPDAQELLADNLVENAIGVIPIPLGIATNMIVDGQDVLVPMATEESSVVAAVCNGAKACRASGGIKTDLDPPHMIAQIQLIGIKNTDKAARIIAAHSEDIAAICNDCDPVLNSHGGGFRAIELRDCGPFHVAHLIVDVRDAMGANTVNTMAEKLAPQLANWLGARAGLCILSNLADRRLVRAKAIWHDADLGEGVAEAVVNAYEFAAHDPYRAATHNKGIMNGISAVALATGGDTRAIEAGAHAYAAQGGYGPLTRYWRDDAGNLNGEIELPLAVGIVGGAAKAHPTAQACLDIMETRSAARLAAVMAATGLVQNFSALRALATVGIQQGHMRLHARNIAIAAGAEGGQIDRIAAAMISDGKIREDVAREMLTSTDP